jgi:hypothetical protein
MARRKSSSTSTHSRPSGDPVSEFADSIRVLENTVGTAKRHQFRLRSHNYYGPKAQDQLAALRKFFLTLKNAFPREKYPEVGAHLAEIEPQVEAIRLNLNNPAADIGAVLQEMRQRVRADLAVAIQAIQSGPQMAAPPFLPPEIIPNGVYRRVIEEANECYRSKCYNACAAMLRRLVESLIIEAFEAKGIESKIKVDGEYQELKALIGKAVAEQQLRLGRNTRDALPKLKFFGDLSVHSRRNLVRESDLARLHGDVRVAVEELAIHMQNQPAQSMSGEA